MEAAQKEKATADKQKKQQEKAATETAKKQKATMETTQKEKAAAISASWSSSTGGDRRVGYSCSPSLKQQ